MAKQQTTKKKVFKKKEKKNVPNGIVHIQATFNNTLISITDLQGNLVAQGSCGAESERNLFGRSAIANGGIKLARDRGKQCRMCRREGMKLFLKGEKCYKPSCPIEKRGTQPPGQHGQTARRAKLVGYGEQLREKQRVKRIYNLLEGQFRNYFEKAARQKGVTGET